MSILDASLRKTWDALRARKQVQDDFLDEVRLKGLRGIRNLRVAVDYPVSVVAGPNGCGKSTVLFACAAAYAPAGRSARTHTPATLFPGFSDGGGAGGFVDEAGGTALEFYYLAGGARYSMVWRKGRSWSRSFMGRKDVRQPERALYLRTLANLTNPSEVRGLLQLGRGVFDAEEITPDLLLFARRILPQKYRGVSLLRGRNRDLLFAGLDRDDAVRYSEFHMSAGERAILRMSKDVSSLKGALILIDEIEAGLHPWTQQQFMLELQRIALRNDLQVVVTTHSPVVLDSVPPEGRIFLERDAATLDVTRRPAWRDIFQKALYGQSTDRLSILCEDEVAEGVILGVLDVLNYRHDDFVVGDGARVGRRVDAGCARDCADRRQTGNRGGPRRDGGVQRRAHGADRRVAAGRRPLMAEYPWFRSGPGAGLLTERTDFRDEFDGNRWNDMHYTNAVKRAARARKAAEAGRREGDAR